MLSVVSKQQKSLYHIYCKHILAWTLTIYAHVASNPKGGTTDTYTLALSISTDIVSPANSAKAFALQCFRLNFLLIM